MSLRLTQHLLFDLDGTLLDSLPGIVSSVDYACREAGLAKPSADLRKMLGPPIRSILSKAVPTDDTGLLDRLEAAFRANYDTQGWQKTSCFAGAREALAELKAAGYWLFVVSNKPLHISLRILEREGLLPLFEKIYTLDSRTPPYASKAEMLRVFLDDYGAPPTDCLMVGDTMDDITAAGANLIPAVLLEHGYGEVAPTVKVRFRAQDFPGLLALLTAENGK